MANEQEQKQKAYVEREEGMNVTRMFIFIIVGFGLFAGFLAIATPGTGSSAQPMVRVSFKCLVIPGFVIGITMLSLLWRGITGSWSDRNQLRREMKAQRRAEKVAKAAPAQEPAKSMPVSAPKKTSDSSSMDEYIKEMNARKERQRAQAEEVRRKRAEKRAAEEAERQRKSDEFMKRMEESQRR